MQRPRMQSDEVENFLRLAMALKLLLAASVTGDSLQRATSLLTDYLLQLDTVSLPYPLYFFYQSQ